MKKIILIFVTGFVTFTHVALALETSAVARLEPIDETAKNPSFATFKEKLKTAVQKKDSAFIRNVLSKSVRYTFGPTEEGVSPVDGFLKEFKVEDKKASQFWKDLKEVLDLGCTAYGEEFICPYVFSKWPDEYDSYDFVAVTSEKVPIRKKAEPSADVIRFAKFEILKLAHGKRVGGWKAIDLGKGSVGFVSEASVRGATDYRAGFEKTGNGWKLKYFIAGD